MFLQLIEGRIGSDMGWIKKTEGRVDSDMGWIKSGRSSNGNCCVEVRALSEGRVAIRDSKFRRDPSNDLDSEPIVVVPSEVFQGLLASIRDGGDVNIFGVHVDVFEDGSASIGSVDGKVTLAYTAQEWDAFIGGVCDGDFDQIGVTVLA